MRSQSAGFKLQSPVYSYVDANWTGPGLMQLTSGAAISVVVDNLPVTNEYHLAFRYIMQVTLSNLSIYFWVYLLIDFVDLLIIYRLQAADQWANVQISVSRPGPASPGSLCSYVNPSEDTFKMTWLNGGFHVIIDVD